MANLISPAFARLVHRIDQRVNRREKAGDRRARFGPAGSYLTSVAIWLSQHKGRDFEEERLMFKLPVRKIQNHLPF